MHSRRELLYGVIGVAVGFVATRRSFGASTVVEARNVSGFDEVVFAGVGDMTIEQTSREQLTVEAEPTIARMIVTEVRGRQLWIGMTAGGFVTQQPIRFRLEVKSLRRLDMRGSGDVHLGRLDTDSLALVLTGSGDVTIGRLEARTLDVRIAGSGDVEFGGGQIESQRITVDGSGDVAAARLSSRDADVALDGSGDVMLAVSQRLTVHIRGSGDVRYVGDPRVTQTVTGSGSVARVAAP